MTIFLSYSSRDRDFVRRLAGDLGRASIGVWLDERELRVGEQLTSIGEAIARADRLVVVVSAASANSYWVAEEIDMADAAGVRVLPVLLEDVPPDWAPRLSGMAHADFRRPAEYRRATHRLVAAIQGVRAHGMFLRAKEAVTLVRAEHAPVGELFGVSQQGVANLYSLANTRDWEFADVTDGTSRFWITEFHDGATGAVHTFAVVDGRVEMLPGLYRYDADPAPVAGSVVVMSCALNHLKGMSEEEAAAHVEKHRDQTTKITRRYTRFRPVPLVRPFVDSDVAVAAALASLSDLDRSADLMTLTRLERDKRAGGRPTWVVAFFDPTLTESVRAVAVDAGTGEVLEPDARTELLNADFFSTRADEAGGVTISIAHQLRAFERHLWDIPERLTARDAVVKARELLAARYGTRSWQLGFLSNTGVVESVAAPEISARADALMNSAGRAGQWVVEVLGLTATPVSEDGRSGTAYDYKRILCTASGAVEQPAADRLVLTAPLSATPVPGPDELLEAADRARERAVRRMAEGYTSVSVALARTPPGASWIFRFYRGDDLVARTEVSVDGSKILG
ncbi:toll/interleukin-1 receptor domain-containing protein [Amycolatopsis sp. NPDC021455]|uniref:toll/interleukin-1 receptor domain-containing protein n=1 Tax=Amycolatopsis sp. NPDC021455 TaxID=3154901 RepID=UPI0033DC5637